MAFEILMKRYQNRILFYCIKILGPIGLERKEIEDLVIEIFSKACLSIDRFRIKSSFSAWIYTIAHNICFDQLREQRRKSREISLDRSAKYENNKEWTLLDSIEDPIESPENEYEIREIYNIANECINRLEDKYRAIVILLFFENFTKKEISHILDISPNAVLARQKRAFQLLRRCIGIRFDFEY